MSQPASFDLRELQTALREGDLRRVAAAAAVMRPHELAEMLLHLQAVELARLQLVVGTERLADAVAQLDPSEAARIMARVSRALAADLLEEMEPDDATDVVEELDSDEAELILAEMQPGEAEEIRELLAYPPETAGGRMTPSVVALFPHLTVAAAMRQIRAQAPDAETIYYVYVIDPSGELVGVVSLRDLITADPQDQVQRIMRRQVLRVPAQTDQETVARLIRDHDILAIPVVDDMGRLLGVVTADDVVDVLEEEATEDIEMLGGSQPLNEPYLAAPILELVRKRVGWLLILFVAGTLTSFVLQSFEDALLRVVALSFFVPLLIGTGGNVGSQIVTTVVRALALGDVTTRDTWRVLRRELVVGACLSLIMAAAMFARAHTMAVGPQVALVVAIAAMCIVIWSALVAAVLPLLLQRLGLDPAVVSAPLIITVVDGTGLLLYLTVAQWVLDL